MLKRLSLSLFISLWTSPLALANPTPQVDHQAQAAGPMVGAVEITQAKIWIQTRKSTEVKVKYWKQNKPKSAHWSLPITTQRENAFTAHFTLSLLQEGTPYNYAVFSGQTLLGQGQFKTQAFWRPSKQPPNFSFAMGSCVFVNDPDIPSITHGGDYHIFKSILNKKPDFMLWMGDNTYLLEPDFYSPARMDLKYRMSRALPHIKPLMANLPNYAIWDDHDFGDNDSGRTYPLRETSLKTFKNYWANPTYGNSKTPGIFSKFSYGDVDFFLTDNRYHRASFKYQGKDKPFFGKAQLQWLKENLRVSKATFKMIVIGNEVLNTKTPSENYYSHKAEYAEFLNWLQESKIPGILILSGDRHHSELLKLKRTNTYPLYELSSSPLTSRAYPPFPVEKVLKERVENTLVVKRNFGFVTVQGPLGQRTLKLQIFDSQGKAQWKHIIPQKDLRP